MSKIYMFIIILPVIAILLFKSIAFYEYDTKQKIITDLAGSIADKVRLTGVLTLNEYNGFKDKLNSFGKFDASGITLKKGYYENGQIVDTTDYIPGQVLNKGDAFMVYIKSSDISNYSRIQNGGVADESNNLYLKAKVQCRVEKYD